MRVAHKGWAVISEPDLLLWSTASDNIEEVYVLFEEWRKKYPAHTFSIRRVTVLIEDEESL
jgi:hypothetical protein